VIASYSSHRFGLFGRMQAAALLTVVLLASLGAATMVFLLGDMAVGVLVLAAIFALTAWRARYGLYATLFLAVAFEPLKDDPVMYYGWLIQSNVSTTTPLTFLSFSPIELIVLMTAIAVLAGSLVERRPLRAGVLNPLVLTFMALLAGSFFWGVIKGGNLTIALWEIRSLLLACLIALLIPNVLHTPKQTERALQVVCIATLLVSVEIIWRHFALVVPGRLSVPKDMIYAHETTIFMNFMIILLLARLVWPASGRQRLWALLIPLLLFAQAITERRAGWVSLDIALVLVAIFIFRMKRKVFYYLVLPLCIVYLGYLGAFWNADGAIAQPARAVRSINDPEGRDLSSNLYRLIERQNIRANPITGLGFGQPYIFYYSMPDLSWWIFWHYIPHNGVMWVWMKMGTAGFLALLTLVGVGLVRGVQILKQSSVSRSAPYLVAIVSLLIMLFVYSYVDIGLNNTRVAVMLGLALGVIGCWKSRSTEEEAVA